MLKKLINNYAFEKFKHLELSDTILEHSQNFSDSIKILQALGQANRQSNFIVGNGNGAIHFQNKCLIAN